MNLPMQRVELAWELFYEFFLCDDFLWLRRGLFFLSLEDLEDREELYEEEIG